MARNAKKDENAELIATLAEKVSDLMAKIEVLEQRPVVAEAQISVKRKRGEARADVYYILLAVPDKGMPPQAILSARILATAADVKHIPEAEAMALFNKAAETGRLVTDQEPWRIFQYYRPRLIEGNYLLMKSL